MMSSAIYSKMNVEQIVVKRKDAAGGPSETTGMVPNETIICLECLNFQKNDWEKGSTNPKVLSMLSK